MIEKQYFFNKSEEKLIEQMVNDDNVMINHVVLAKGDKLPEHNANSHVHLIINSGTITLQLAEQEEKSYKAGSIINIPFKTKMNISNSNNEPLDFFVIKAPNPKNM